MSSMSMRHRRYHSVSSYLISVLLCFQLRLEVITRVMAGHGYFHYSVRAKKRTLVLDTTAMLFKLSQTRAKACQESVSQVHSTPFKTFKLGSLRTPLFLDIHPSFGSVGGSTYVDDYISALE
ncbi:hypothetical protein SCHPADRAFT_223116 [Schizopora paradoxa]|uniref:Uncharacterized protein n=1 Tax=Schizopora paradoxa TaxID=27342 RepID=A0A0H2RX20_9AGAM|nr:hypothetical protein SCHPADRAFT_223116 [Schizopora paradoxa]